VREVGLEQQIAVSVLLAQVLQLRVLEQQLVI
jgi:hypothetical protein